jgi:hypothetical protein
MFKLADFALANGDRESAARIYRALAGDADREVRLEARFRHARQLATIKRNGDAAVLLRAIVDEKPDAVAVRLELAGLLHTLGEEELALRELRAAQASGLPANVARLVDRFSDALRAARPIGASFEVAIAPDNNINRSTRSDTLGTVIGDFEIGEDSKATSGIGLSLQGQAFRRFAYGSGDISLLVRASAAADLYRKSRFNDITLDLAAGPEFRLGRNRVTIAASAIQRLYGMAPFMRAARLSATLTRPIGSRTQLQLTGSAGLADYRLNDLQDGKTYFGRVRLERALSETTGIAATASLFRNSAKDPAYATTEWRGGLLLWRDVGRATLTVEAELGRLRADARLALLPDARADRYRRLSFGATFRRLTFGGFAPVTRITFERNQSSVQFYDIRRTRTEFGVVRAF